MLQVPSVTMNGGRRRRVTRTPLIRPQARPVSRPSRKAIGTGTPATTASLPITTEDRTMIAPTDRSMPAVRMIRVCAIPTMPMIVTCCRIRDRLNGWKNLAPTMALNSATPSSSTMNGIVVG